MTEAVRRAPHSIVLLDELEKAHGDVLNVLLQILEDGMLTDGKGRTVNFKNTIVVMTSNVGSGRILELSRRTNEEDSDSYSDSYAMLSHIVKEELEYEFKPELLNCVDDIVIFAPLSTRELTLIAELLVLETVTRAKKEQDIDLMASPSLLATIVMEGSLTAAQFSRTVPVSDP